MKHRTRTIVIAAVTAGAVTVPAAVLALTGPDRGRQRDSRPAKVYAEPDQDRDARPEATDGTEMHVPGTDGTGMGGMPPHERAPMPGEAPHLHHLAEVLGNAVEDGVITGEQADALLARFADAHDNGRRAMSPGGDTAETSDEPDQNQDMSQNSDEVDEPAVTTEDAPAGPAADTDRVAPEAASSPDAPPYLRRIGDVLRNAVEDGVITGEQADALLARFADAHDNGRRGGRPAQDPAEGPGNSKDSSGHGRPDRDAQPGRGNSRSGSQQP